MLLVSSFIYGAYFAFNLCCSVAAYAMRSNKAPYREALAWLSLASALQCLAQFFTIIFPEIHYLSDIEVIISRDALAIPLMMMEIDCIYNQNLTTLPWRERWKKVALCEIPFAAFFAIAIFADWQYLIPVMYVFCVPFVGVFTVRMLLKIREYNRVLSYTTDSMHRSVSWAGWVFGINISIIVLYTCVCTFFESEIMSIVYILVVLCLGIVHAYFIFTQRPENTHEIMRVRKILQAEHDVIKAELNKKIQEVEKQKDQLDEKQSHIDVLSKEMEENAVKLKRKATIKEYMNTAQLQHPHFDKKLNIAADGKMTNHDLLICMLIYDGKRTSFIANMIGVNTRSVEMARSRLRRKLHLLPEDNLRDTIVTIIDQSAS